MLRHRSSAAAVAAFVAVVLGSTTSAQEVALRFHWTKGETLRYRVTQQANVTMSNLPGMGDMNVTSTVVQVQQFAVQDIAPDGTATVSVTFESVKMEMISPMATISYDSAAPPKTADPMTDMMAKSFGAIVGQSVTLVVAPNGAIKKIDGLTAIAQKMSAALPPGAAAGGLPGMSPMMTEDTIRGMFEQNFAALPDRPVKTGETWKHDNKVKTAMGLVETAATFTLKGVEAREGSQFATLGMAATNKITMDPAATASLPMTMTMGPGTSQGDVVFDVKGGHLQRSTIQSTQPMSMSMTGPDGSSLNIEAITRTNLTVELVQK